MLISIVIPTYNRKDLLEAQVAALKKMEQSESPEVEVLYIDNNSRDGTAEKLAELFKNTTNFRIVVETRQGASWSRNRGYTEATGEYVWYMDDDSLPHRLSLSAYMTALPEWRPQVAGGPIIPSPVNKIPWWFDAKAPEFRAYLAQIDHGSETGWLDSGLLWAPNLVVRRQMLTEIGGFNASLGPNGKRRFGNDEDDIVRRIRDRGGRVLYVHDAIVHHVILPQQLAFSFYMKQRFDRGVSTARALHYQGVRGTRTPSAIARIVGHGLYSISMFATGRVFRAVDHMGACVGSWGKLSESWRLNHVKNE